MCAIGEVHPERIVRNSEAKPGDALVLTKPIGTGIISTAIKAGTAPADAIATAVASMVTLNRSASEAMLAAGVDAATDITGYGLLGHLRNMVRASGVAARIAASAVPILPHALELARQGVAPGGTRRNRTDLADFVEWDAAIPEPMRTVLCDAQTSGGLLIALPPDRVDRLVHALNSARTLAAAHIGEITDDAPGTIRVTR